MTTTGPAGFERRSAIPQVAGRSPAPAEPGRPPRFDPRAWSPAPASVDADEEEADAGERLNPDFEWPVLTLALCAGLIAIYVAQTHLAFDTPQANRIDLASLRAQGASSHELVFARGEWQRLFTSSLLHGGHWHAGLNAFALFMVGVRLEGLIGRIWMAAIYGLSGLATALASVFYNDPQVMSVGASGAICGLVAALFVVSFFVNAEPDEAWNLRRMALFFGIPALAPVLLGTGAGGTDYAAHLGGALAGAALACVALYCLIDEQLDRPGLRLALAVVAVYTVLTVSAVALVANAYPAQARKAADLMPQRDVPSSLKVDGGVSDYLLGRYPRDPRVHLIRAVHHADRSRYGEAERHLAEARRLAGADRDFISTVRAADAINAFILIRQGRHNEARAFARAACSSKQLAEIAVKFRAMGLCD